MAKVWLIASGKGGVGKSTVASGLGIALSRMNRRVCIIDADIGLRDQDALLGLENRIVYDVVDVAHKDCLLAEALISPEEHPLLSLLPASQFDRVKALEPKAFRKILTELRAVFDDILIDCPAGIERGVRGLLSNRIDETVLVCTPDDVCIRNAERVVSIMEQKQAPRPQLIVNRLNSELIREGEMYNAMTVAGVLDLPLLGEIPDDSTLYRAMLAHRSFMDLDCEARRAVERIACRLLESNLPLPAYGSEALPWYKRLFPKRRKEV